MNGFYTVRGICSLLFSVLLGWVILTKCDADAGFEGNQDTYPKYSAILNGLLLPVFLIVLLISGIPVYGFKKALEMILPSFLSIFLHISVYYLLLIAIMPLLHRHISSRTCAMLWIIPNYLYISIQPTFELNRPLFVLHISQNIMYILLAVWLTGFLFVLMRAILQHFIFRRSILKSSSPVTDPEILEVWQTELADARIRKPKYKLLVSSAVNTPLSFGMTNNSTRIILPHTDYTKDELTLIFRHEIIHICRCDSANKFFMVFCCAMCWFNPLMWIAMRKSAEDLELSCDESVLLETNDEARKQYANLILSASGDGRGFTTCLSASSKTMRYRLRSIVKTSRKRTGALIVAVLFFILLMTCGFTTISYGNTTFHQVCQDKFGGEYEVDAYNTSLISHNGHLECNNENALKSYLGSLPLQKVSGNYAFEDFENYLWLFIDVREKSYYVKLNDYGLEIIQLGVNTRSDTYLVNTQIDWEYLRSLFYAYHIQDPDSIFPPQMYIRSSELFLDVSGSVLSYTAHGKEHPAESWWESEFETSCLDPQVKILNLQFSHVPSEPFRIFIDDLQGNIKEYTSDDLPNSSLLPIVDWNADYTICVKFEDQNSQIEMSYKFEVRYTE